MGKQQNIPSSFSETEQAFLNELSGASNKPVPVAKSSATTPQTPIEPSPTTQPSNKGGEEYNWGKSFSNSIVDLVIAPQTAFNMGKTITGQFLSNLFGMEEVAKDFAEMGEKKQQFIDMVADTYKFDTPQAKRSAINKIDLKTEPISQVYQQALKESDKNSIIPAPLKAGIQAAPEAAKQAYKAVVGALYDPETDIVETLQDLSVQVAPMLIPMGIGKWGSAGKAVKAAAGAYNTALATGASAAEIAELSTGLTKAVAAAKKTGQLSSFVVGTLQAIPSALEDARKAGLSNEQIPAFVLASSTGQTIMDALVPTIGEFGKGINKEVAKVTADQLTKESFYQLSNIVSESDFFRRSLELGISKGIGNKLGAVAKKAGVGLLKTGIEGVKEGLNEGIMSEGIGNIGVQQLFNAYNDARGRNLQVGKGNFAPFSQAGSQLLGATIAGAFSGTALTTSSAVLGSVGNKPFRSLWNTGQYIPTAYAVLEDAYVRSAALPDNQRAEAFNQNVEAVKSGLEKNFSSGVLNDQQYQQGLSAIDGMAKSISGFGYNTPASNYAKYNHYLYTQVNIPQTIGSVVQGLGLDATSGIPPEVISSIQQNIASTLQAHAYDASIPPFSKQDLTAIIESTPNLSPEQRSALRVKYANLDEGLQQTMRQHNFNRLVLNSLEATGQVDENAISEGNKAIKNWKIGAEFNAPVGDTGLEYESDIRKVANISDDGQVLIDQNGEEFDAKLVRFATKPDEEIIAETPVEESKVESSTTEPTLTKAQQADANLKPFDGTVKSGALYRFRQTSPIYETDDKGKNKLDFQGNPIQAKLSDGTPRVKVEDGYATFEQDYTNPDNYEVTVTSDTKSSDAKINTKRQTISVPKSGFDPTTKSFRIGEASLDILGESPSQVPEMAEAPVKPAKGKKAEAPTYKVVNREYDNQLTQVKDLTEENFQGKLPIGTLIPFTDSKGNASWYQVTSHGVNRSTDESTVVVVPVVIKQSGDETKIQRLSNSELSAKGITGLSSIPISLLGEAKVLNPSVFAPKQQETVKTEENEQPKAKEDSANETEVLDESPSNNRESENGDTQSDTGDERPDSSAKESKVSPLDKLVGKPVIYKGNKGSIIYDETDGYVFQYEKGNREIILGKENVAPKEIQEVVVKQNPLKRQVNVTSDKSVTIDGKQYEIVTNKNGSVVGLKSDSGTITNEAALIAVEVQRNNFDPEAVNERIDEVLQQAGEDPVTIAAIDNIFNNNITERVENLLANGSDESTTDADYLQAELFVEAVSKGLDRFPDSAYAKAMKESLQQFQKDLDETADKYTKEPPTEQPEPTVEAESDVITGNAPQEQIDANETVDNFNNSPLQQQKNISEKPKDFSKRKIEFNYLGKEKKTTIYPDSVYVTSNPVNENVTEFAINAEDAGTGKDIKIGYVTVKKKGNEYGVSMAFLFDVADVPSKDTPVVSIILNKMIDIINRIGIGIKKIPVKIERRPTLAGNGIGKKAYVQIGEYVNNELGGEFYSDKSRSDYSEGLWRSLEKSGFAEKVINDDVSSYIKEPDPSMPYYYRYKYKSIDKAVTNTESSTADKIVAGLKTLKIDTKNKAFDAVLGIPVAAWNASVDSVIALVRAGQSLQQAINQQYNFLKNTYNPQLDKDAYEAEIRRGQNAKRPVTTQQPPSPVVPSPDTVNPAYSANPTDNKFSYDPIESNNTYDSIGIGYNQEATNELVDNNETRIKEASANREAVRNGFELLEKDARTRFEDGVITKQQLTDIIKDLNARKALELEKYTDVANKIRIEAANRLIAPNGLIDAKPELVQKDIYGNYQTLMSTAAGTYLGKLLNKTGLGLPNLISKEAAINSSEAGIGHFNWNALLATMMRKGSTLHNVFVESKNGWDNLSATAKNKLSEFEAEAMAHPEIAKWSLLNNGTKGVTRSNIAKYAGGTISVAETFTDSSGNSFANDEYSDTDNLEVPKAVLVSIAMSMRTDKETQGSYNLNTHIKKEVGGGIVPIQFADQEQAETFVDNVFANQDVQDFDKMRQDFFTKAYPLINEVYKKTRGVNLPDLGEQYWPLIKSASTVNASGDEKTSTPFFGIKALHKDPGIIKSRTRDKFSAIVAGDALATMNGYGREIVDFIAVEPLVHNFNALYNQNKGFFEGKQQIKGTMIGKGAGYGLVMSQLRSLTQKWVNPEKQRGYDFMNELMKSFQTSVLAANQGTVFVQSGAAVSTFDNGMINNKYIKSSIRDTMLPLFANAFFGSKNIPEALKKMGLSNSDERWGIYQKKLNSLHKELEGLENGQAIVNRIDNVPTRILTDNIVRSASDKDLILTGKKIQSSLGKFSSNLIKGFGARDFFSTHFFGQMQLADSSVILMLYEAGKKQVADMSKAEGKNLTEKQIQEEAAILATRVMYDTQQTFDTTDKSNIQNNNRSMAKYVTVFATQPYKNLSRAYEMQYNAALDPKNNYLKKIANDYARNYFLINQFYNAAIKTLYGALSTATAAAVLKGVGADELAEEELNKFRDNMGNVSLTMYSVLSQIVPWVGVAMDLGSSMSKDAEAGIEVPALQGVGKIINAGAVLKKDADSYSQARNNQYQGTKMLIDGAAKMTGTASIFTKTLDNAVLKPLLKPIKGIESNEAKEKKDAKKTSALGAAFREVMGTQTPAEIKSKRNFEKAQRKAQKTYEQ